MFSEIEIQQIPIRPLSLYAFKKGTYQKLLAFNTATRSMLDDLCSVLEGFYLYFFLNQFFLLPFLEWNVLKFEIKRLDK